MVGRLASLCVLHLASRAKTSGTNHSGNQSTKAGIPMCASAALSAALTRVSEIKAGTGVLSAAVAPVLGCGDAQEGVQAK